MRQKHKLKAPSVILGIRVPNESSDCFHHPTGRVAQVGLVLWLSVVVTAALTQALRSPEADAWNTKYHISFYFLSLYYTVDMSFNLIIYVSWLLFGNYKISSCVVILMKGDFVGIAVIII